MRWLLPFSLLACKGPSTPIDPGTCPQLDEPYAELSQGDGWDLTDGTPVEFGIPPQGGAPYAPFEIRLIGMVSSDWYTVDMAAYDTTTAEMIGTETFSQRFVCANVGEHAGTRYTPELHMRFYGWEPPEIDGAEVDVEITISPEQGDPVVAGYRGVLDWVLGPLPE